MAEGRADTLDDPNSSVITDNDTDPIESGGANEDTAGTQVDGSDIIEVDSDVSAGDGGSDGDGERRWRSAIGRGSRRSRAQRV